VKTYSKRETKKAQETRVKTYSKRETKKAQKIRIVENNIYKEATVQDARKKRKSATWNAKATLTRRTERNVVKARLYTPSQVVQHPSKLSKKRNSSHCART
jgi:hypothetical protein